MKKKRKKNPLVHVGPKKLTLKKFINDIKGVLESNKYNGYSPTEKLEVINRKCKYALKNLV